MLTSSVCLFYPPSTFSESFKHHCILHTNALNKAISELGLKSTLLAPKKNKPEEFLNVLKKNPFDCTLSFNGLLPDKKGRFLADLIETPHVAYVIDALLDFLPLAQSPLNYIALPDRQYHSFFQMMGCKRSFFLPPAVIEEPISYHKKEIDFLVLDDCIDYESIEESFKKEFPEMLVTVIQDTIEKALSMPSKSYIEHFVSSLNAQNQVHPKDIPLLDILKQIEKCVKGRELIKQLRELKEYSVHIFGKESSEKGFDYYLKSECPNRMLHTQVTDNLIAQSKVLVTNSAHIRDGFHEKSCQALREGTFVFSSYSKYMQEYFDDTSGLVALGQKNVHDKLATWCRLDDGSYMAHIEKARKLIDEHHTYTVRAKQLQSALIQFI